MSDRGYNWKLAFNFGCVCLIWGSTFLAIKYAIDGIPPFVVTSSRYVMASLVLVAISRLRNERTLTFANIRLAAISGLLLALGNALVCYSETSLPTSLVAVVIGSLPAWIILLDWKVFQGKPPLWGQVAGIALSLVGVAALTSSHSRHIDVRNLFVWIALFSSIAVWSMGTLIQRKASVRDSLFLFSAVQSATGGLLIGATTIADGSLFFSWDQVPTTAVLAVVYLALAGTVAASTSYVWLSQNAEPRLVSTYALITPVVAVWLGWLIAGEGVTQSTLINSATVVAGVGLIALSGKSWRSNPRLVIRPEASMLPDSVVLKLRSPVETG